MTLRSILMRISASMRRRSLDAGLDEEVRAHLDLLARDYERGGLSPEQARLAARRDFGGVEQMAEGMLALNQGTIYPALLRLEQKGWIESDWGISENNRRARFYSMTRAGRKQLAIEADLWSRTVAMMSRMLGESSS